ncbi:hypothetical protein [Jannaschia sp. R86511]|uniref:hypothetical protein n=1 Tax=Jannaschia sp. R86511 TaxID=3093853 RepID=UPI0036D2B8A6
MPRRHRWAVVAGVVVCAVALPGCGDQIVDRTVGVVYCTSPSLGEGTVERVEYRQGEEVVASTQLEVGTTYRAEVPAGELTRIFVDGRLAGSSGAEEPDPETTVTGRYTALLGEGCPEYTEP